MATTELVMDMAGTYILPGGIFFDGVGGADELAGPSFDSNWIIDGINSGTVNGDGFANVENVTGGAGNEDIFSILAGGQITGVMEGGDGGFDTVEAIGNGSSTILSVATAPDAGSITLDGLKTDYDGLEPITLSGGGAYIIDLDSDAIPGDNDVATLDFVLDLGGGIDQYLLSGATFENHTIEVDNNDTVSIDLGTGTDEITVQNIDGTNLSGNLSIDLGSGNDKITLGTDYGDISLTGSSGSNTIVVDAVGSTTVLSPTITSAGHGVATLTDPASFASISGANIVHDFSDFANEVDEAFGKIGSLLDEVVGLTDLATELPLIGGSNLVGQAQVAVGKAIGLFGCQRGPEYGPGRRRNNVPVARWQLVHVVHRRDPRAGRRAFQLGIIRLTSQILNLPIETGPINPHITSR